jgi:hypothetical protein
MRKIIIGAAFASLFVASAVYAGAKWQWGLTISRNADGSGDANGTMGSVRNSANDTTSVMECYNYRYPGYAGFVCEAWNATTSLGCSSTDPAMSDLVSKLQGDSYLDFRSDASGNCTFVQTGTGSEFEPKSP